MFRGGIRTPSIGAASIVFGNLCCRFLSTEGDP